MGLVLKRRQSFDILDVPLQQLSPLDVEDVRTANSHKLIMGTTGSAKSTTSYRFSVKAALLLNAGGLFCVAKPEDGEAIRRYCAETGRLGSLIEINAQQGGFNVLAWELARTGSINAVIDMLMAMFEIVRGSGSDPGRTGDQFWQDAPQQMFRASVPILYAATGRVDVGDLLAFVRSAPSTLEEMNSPAWRESSVWAQTFDAAAARIIDGPISGLDMEAGKRAIDYWLEFCRLDPRTQGNIRISVTTLLSRFESGLLRQALCGETTFVPELVLNGAVILMNLPVQVYGEDGAIFQKILKHCTYKVLLARNAMPKQFQICPVIIGADECQNFLFRDAEALQQLRSSNTMVVMATQSLPTIYAKIGGDHPHDRGDYFASAFNTVILHSSACGVTNTWFATKLGRTTHLRQSFGNGESGGQNFNMNMGESSHYGVNSSFGSSSNSGPGGSSQGTSSSFGTSSGGGDNWGRARGNNSGWNSSQSWQEQSDWVLDPGFFARNLLTGGNQNRGRVTAILFRAGACFAATNSNFLMIEMQQ